MEKALILLFLWCITLTSCVDRYDKHWVPVKSYKCHVTWNNGYYSFQCKTKQGDVFNVEMKRHHYYQSEMKHKLYVNAPCEIYLFQDTITKEFYYRLYRHDSYEAHTKTIKKL